MNSDYILLLLALIGLWTPSVVYSPTAIKTKLNHAVRCRDNALSSLLRSKINWLDLVRGAIGTWIIQNSVFNFENRQDELARIVTFIQLAIIGVAVLAQTVRIARTPCIIGPAFFLSGVTLAISGPLVGGFAIALSLTLSLMLGRLSYLFIIAPFCLTIFGQVFGHLGFITVFNAGLIALPSFLSFAFGVRLSFVRRSRLPKTSTSSVLEKTIRVSEDKKLPSTISTSVVQQRAA